MNVSNETSQFEILDILVLISFYIQIDDHNNNRKEYNYLHKHLEILENKVNILLERSNNESKRND